MTNTTFALPQTTSTFHYDIGEMDSDKYEDQQIILHKVGLPFRYPVMPFFLPSNDFNLDEDIPF
jgi:hypothetical protein